MRFAPPTLRRAPRPSPAAPQPPPVAEADLDDSPRPVRRPLRVTGWLRRRKPLNLLMAAGATGVLLCFGIGLGTDAELLTMGSGAEQVSAPKRAEKDKAAAARAAADRARAQKVAAANLADAKAAAERAAEAKATLMEATRKRVVAMPALVGLKLNIAMDVAADAGLTAVTVCRTPDGDTPLWWSNWRVTGQDVAAGTRISDGTPICVSATK